MCDCDLCRPVRLCAVWIWIDFIPFPKFSFFVLAFSSSPPILSVKIPRHEEQFFSTNLWHSNSSSSWMCPFIFTQNDLNSSASCSTSSNLPWKYRNQKLLQSFTSKSLCNVGIGRFVAINYARENLHGQKQYRIFTNLEFPNKSTQESHGLLINRLWRGDLTKLFQIFFVGHCSEGGGGKKEEEGKKRQGKKKER